MKHIKIELSKKQTKKLKKIAEFVEHGTSTGKLGIVLAQVDLHEQRIRLENAIVKVFFLPNEEGVVAVKVLEYLMEQAKAGDDK